MEQTTLQNLQPLLDELQEIRAEREALKKRVRWLEMRLEQRIEKTVNHYQERRSRLDRMQNMALQLFIENPNIPFTYEELVEEWKVKYPDVSCINLPRRIRELAEQNLVWRVEDPETKKALHYLKLEGVEEGEEENSASSK